MVDTKAKVVVHEEVGTLYHHLVLEESRMAQDLRPGQFIHLKVPALEPSALRRPFSVFCADAKLGRLEVLYKTVGRGTKALNRVEVGDLLEVEGPLGKGFPEKCDGWALLVGGGYGVAPLYFLAKRLKESGHEKVILFVGGRTKADLLALDRFASLGVEVCAATEDGSMGTKGFAVVPLDERIAQLRRSGENFELFACGPDGLLKAISDRAVSLGAPGWISTDRHMICGVGACFACIQKTVNGNSRCCVDGPVFAAKDLIWQ